MLAATATPTVQIWLFVPRPVASPVLSVASVELAVAELEAAAPLVALEDEAPEGDAVDMALVVNEEPEASEDVIPADVVLEAELAASELGTLALLDRVEEDGACEIGADATALTVLEAVLEAAELGTLALLDIVEEDGACEIGADATALTVLEAEVLLSIDVDASVLSEEELAAEELGEALEVEISALDVGPSDDDCSVELEGATVADIDETEDKLTLEICFNAAVPVPIVVSQ